MQGESITILTASEKIRGFKMKIAAWLQRAKSDNFDSFETLSNFVFETSCPVAENLKADIIEHLEQLQKSLTSYFPPTTQDLEWLRNPFQENIDREQYGAKEGDQLIDIASDSTLKDKFKKMNINHFWSGIQNEYPEISNRAVKILLPFATTYLCESGFSSYCATKTKYRSRLDAERPISDCNSHYN